MGFKPWVELSAVDQFVMAVEAVSLLFVIALVKVNVDDWRKRRQRQKENVK